MALLLIFLAFGFRPTSFAFGSLELSAALGLGLALVFVWQKKEVKKPALLDHPSFSRMQSALFVLLVYLALHMFYNFKDPFRPGEFSSTNAIKSYFGMAAPFALLWYFSRKPTGIFLKKDFYWTIARLCLLGLVVNLGARAVELATYRAIFIPGIGATSNGYALRTLAPVAMLLSAAALAGANFFRLRPFQRLVYRGMFVLGTCGALLSGGRITIILGFLMVCAVLLLRHKRGLLVGVFAAGLLMLIAAQFAAGWINTQANPFLQRSVQLLLVEKDSQTMSSIESSTNWRWELASRALVEWQSDPRIFWFGRATFGFGAADDRAFTMSGGYEALMTSSLRRGATHNLLTDLLVAYGLVGCVIYIVAYLFLVRFLWRIRRQRDLTPAAANLALVCFLLSILNLTLEIVGAGSVRTELIWLTIILIASLYYGVGIDPTPRTRVTARPAPMPGFALRRGRPTALNH